VLWLIADMFRDGARQRGRADSPVALSRGECCNLVLVSEKARPLALGVQSDWKLNRESDTRTAGFVSSTYMSGRWGSH
jgi:hypothetical protein